MFFRLFDTNKNDFDIIINLDFVKEVLKREKYINIIYKDKTNNKLDFDNIEDRNRIYKILVEDLTHTKYKEF